MILYVYQFFSPPIQHNTYIFIYIYTYIHIHIHILQSQIKELTRSHFCSTCCSIFGAKHICAPVTDNVKLWTKLNMCKSECELVQQVQNMNKLNTFVVLISNKLY